MNRFNHLGIDKAVTPAERDAALSRSGVIRRRKPGRKPTGVDSYALKRLEHRRRAFDTMKDNSGYTRPGSMQRP